MTDQASTTEYPDWQYAVKVFRRQWLPASVVTGIAGTLSVMALFTVKDTFRSSITSVVDTAELNLDTYASKVWAEAAQRNFNIKFSSPDFLQRVIREAKIKDSGISLRSKLFGAKSDEGRKPSTDDTSDETQKLALVKKLTSAITASNVTGDGTLALTVDWDDPAEAQRIATHAMDIWIVSELQDDLEQSKRRLDSLTAITASLQSTNSGNKSRMDTRIPTGAEYNTLFERLESAKREAHNLEDQISESVSQHRLHRVNLEVELERMGSRLTSDHPDVQNTEAELKSVMEAQVTDPALVKALEQKKAEILALRIKLHLVNETASFKDLDSATGTQLMTQLHNYINILSSQIVRPELRSRFHIIRSATFDTKPIKKRRSSFAMLSFGVSLLLGLVFAMYRELSNTLARDAWRVRFHSGLPVWGQISIKSLENFPEITTDIADRLRNELGKDNENDGATRALLGYRQIEVAVRRRCLGRAILFVECSTRGNLRGFFSSLFNIFSTDIAGRILVIDCNHFTTLRGHDENKANPDIGFPQMLDQFMRAPESDWRSMIETANAQCPYDFIGTPTSPTGTLTRIYRESALKPLLEELSKNYDFILIRGLPETHFLENSALAAACSDTFMVVDSQSTIIAEVSRSARQLGNDAVRAAILVGT